jgi:dihydrolipoamide dehydrogenase
MLLIKTIKLQYSADHIIIATGARFHVNYLTYLKMVQSNRLPPMTLPTQPKSMIIVGSGAIGLNLLIYNSMGTKLLL